jgi:uncharacterized protein (DUF2461 family)
LVPLLAALKSDRCDAGGTSTEFTRFRQILRAVRDDWFNEQFLDTAPAEVLTGRVLSFVFASVPAVAHTDLIPRSATLLRHGLTHLLRGSDDPWQRYSRCAGASGPYFVLGLGPRFWGCLLAAVAPERFPVWLPETESGMARTSVIWGRRARGSAAALAEACSAYDDILRNHAGLTAGHLDALFVGAARMTGRELVPASPEALKRVGADRIAHAVRSVRVRQPLRARLAGEGARLHHLRSRLLDALRTDDHTAVTAVLREVVARSASVAGHGGEPQCYPPAVIGGLFRAATDSREIPTDFAEAVDRIGIGAAVATLHLADPTVFPLASPSAARSAAVVDDAFVDGITPLGEYRLLSSLLRHLRTEYRVHPFEFEDVVTAAAEDLGADAAPGRGSFGGFCTDTFRFFADLAGQNSRAWMSEARPRYRFAVREPLVELCTALAARYVVPVMNGEYGWDVECDPRPGKALTSICKNDFGRSTPYQPTLWLTYYPRSDGSRQQAAQLFVRADADGLRYGFHLGPRARTAGRRFRQNVQRHAESLYRALAATDAVETVSFAADDALTELRPVRSPEDLRAWATGKSLAAGRFRPAADPLLRGDELVGEVMLTFDRLVPLFAAAVADDPLPVLTRRAGDPGAPTGYDASGFARDTFLSDVWLDRALGLLGEKRQLVLQGLSGTGKTHVAHCLARLLTRGRTDGVQVVQFHPGYGYAEFVEGPDPDDPAGSRDGILCQFAAKAAVRPAESFVLVIDEITRGHLPTVFGELFFLLESRGHAVTLPYSRRTFRLSENLYIIATAGAADRSAALDQAIRRRFAVVELAPDPAVLARWLDAHPPADADPTFGPRAVRLFERLNGRVERDFGPDARFGHSLFMVTGLDAGKVRAVWEHHVRPAVAALAGDRRGVLAGYDLGRLLGDDTPSRRDGVRTAS